MVDLGVVVGAVVVGLVVAGVVVTIGGGAIILFWKRWVWEDRSVAPPVWVAADTDAWTPDETAVTTGGWETPTTTGTSGWAGCTGWVWMGPAPVSVS